MCVALVQTTQCHRAGDRAHEERQPDGSQLSQGNRRRQDERSPGRLRIQHEKAPASYLLAYFQRAGTAQIAVAAVKNIRRTVCRDDLKT